MTGHSAVTLIAYEKTKIRFFETKDFHANCYQIPKHVAVKRLSADILQYSEKSNAQYREYHQYKNKPVPFHRRVVLIPSSFITTGWRNL